MAKIKRLTVASFSAVLFLAGVYYNYKLGIILDHKAPSLRWLAFNSLTLIAIVVGARLFAFAMTGRTRR